MSNLGYYRGHCLKNVKAGETRRKRKKGRNEEMGEEWRNGGYEKEKSKQKGKKTENKTLL